LLTNSIDRSYWKAGSFSCSQEILHTLRSS